MSAPVTSAERAAVTDRLRAAGCVFAEAEAAVLVQAARDAAELADLTARRAAGFPLEQVVGYADFAGVRVRVRPGVFVPRRRTEALVRQAVGVLRPGDVVLDLCCGTGALAVAVAARVPDLVVHAADLDPAAVACARDNLAPLGARVHAGDLFDALPAGLRGRVAVLLANVPYVPTGELHLLPAEARCHEPRAALDGGPDGLDVARRVAAAAPGWLAPGGRVLLESTAAQAPAAGAALRAAGLAATAVSDDELGSTVVVGTAGRGPS